MIQFFSFGDCSWWSNSHLQCFIFSFSGVPSFLGYIVANLHLNHRKASPCVFNFSFFLSSFYYRISSWRFYMVVHSDSFSFVIISIHSFFPILPMVHEDFLKFCAISLLIHSTRISSMPNPLFVINLIWWRISIQ